MAGSTEALEHFYRVFEEGRQITVGDLILLLKKIPDRYQ
jgi:hypothetical protein